MTVLWEKTLKPGEKWSGNIRKGKLIKFTALQGGANLSLLIYNGRDLTERYNMPDTLKAQHTSRLTKGNVLMSDNGRVLASIVVDSLGWNDTISGVTTREMTDLKYGKTAYQEKRNEYLRCGYENFAVELVRNGLDTRDMVTAVNLFSKVQCDETGNMKHIQGHCKKGDTVTLRSEMDLLLLLSNTPNPLDEGSEHPLVPVLIEISDAEAVCPDDYCVNFRDENKRAFENTWDYHRLTDF